MATPFRERARSNGKRLLCLDEVRALAIAAMIIAHFGSGTAQRLDWLWPFQHILDALGVFATPAFVVVFGVAIGLVYYPRFVRDRRRVSAQLYGRAAVVALAAIAVRLPAIASHLGTGDGVLPLLYSTYSVLAFYTLAVASVPLWLRVVAARPHLLAPALGIGLWMLGEITVAIWPYDPALGWGEWFRLYLVSGKYAYLQMMGTALCVVPLGLLLAEAPNPMARAGAYRTIMTIGWVCALAGFAKLLVSQEGVTHELMTAGLLTSRPAFFCMVGGAALFILGGLGLLHDWCPRAATMLYPLALFGQCALVIYVGHAFVLPLLAGLDATTIALTGMARVGVPLVLFALFITVVLVRQHHRTERTRSSVPPGNAS